jgi:hypothetical protein
MINMYTVHSNCAERERGEACNVADHEVKTMGLGIRIAGRGEACHVAARTNLFEKQQIDSLLLLRVEVRSATLQNIRRQYSNNLSAAMPHSPTFPPTKSRLNRCKGPK